VSQADADVLELVGNAGQRLLNRMSGLTDDEWAWQPIAGDAKVTIRWRLDHIAQALGEQRNWVWLGAPAEAAPQFSSADSANAAVASVELMLERFSALVRRADAGLGSAIGTVAGPYGDASRQSLVLHVADELIHHSAEAALLRDLYAAR
jgi:hypothetical protein